MPHSIAKHTVARKVVVVGTRTGRSRGGTRGGGACHEVVVFEAASDPRGQVRLTAQSPPPAGNGGSASSTWRMSQWKNSASLPFQYWAEAEAIQAENPDVVIIATGGLPLRRCCREATTVVSAWDIISAM